MPIPALVNQEVNGLLRATPANSSLVCVIGCSSNGTPNQLWLGSRVTDLVNAFGRGPGVELAAVKAAAGFQVAFIKLPAAAAGSNGAVTFTGTGTSVVTVSGTPYDKYSMRFIVDVGGTIGSNGIKFRYSKNGGVSYSLTYYLGTATSFQIPDTGLTLNFAAGTLVAGDLAQFTTTAPAPDAAGVNAAIELLRTTNVPVDCVALGAIATASTLQAMDQKILSIKTHGKHIWGLAGWRIPAGGESNSTYRDSVEAAYSSVASDKLGLATWSSSFTSSIDGTISEQSPLYASLNVLTPSQISENPAAISGHAIPTTLNDEAGALIYHDALYDESLSDRSITLRTWPGQPGVYITRARLMSAPADSCQLIIHRRLVNRAEQLADNYFARIVNTPVRASADGKIATDEALRIQGGMQAMLEDGLAADASAVKYVIDKNINIITASRIEGDLYIQPFGYPETIITRIALTATIETSQA